VSSSVAVEREAVDHEGVAHEVEELTLVSHAVGAAEPEGVVEVAVDALGVVASCVEFGEVRVVRRITRTFSVRLNIRPSMDIDHRRSGQASPRRMRAKFGASSMAICQTWFGSTRWYSWARRIRSRVMSRHAALGYLS